MRRDAEGKPVSEFCPGAVASRCLVGWIDDTYGLVQRPAYTRRVFGELGLPPAPENVRMNDDSWADYGVTCWNDEPGRTFEEVRELCRKLDI